MPRTLPVLTALVLGLAAAPGATASPITFTSTFDPDDVTFAKTGPACSQTDSSGTTSGCTLSWTHLLEGFDSSVHVLSDAAINLWLYDSSDSSAEKYDLLLDSLDFNNLQVSSGATKEAPTRFSLSLIPANGGLLSDAQIVATLTHSVGSFTFDRATLTATWDVLGEQAPVEAAVVPEPGSLLLLGTGIGFAAARMRGRRSSRGHWPSRKSCSGARFSREAR